MKVNSHSTTEKVRGKIVQYGKYLQKVLSLSRDKSEKEGKERRKDSRFSRTSIVVRVIPYHPILFFRARPTLEVLDLSENGIALKSEALCRVGDYVKLDLNYKGADVASLFAFVTNKCRQDDGSVRIGMQFDWDTTLTKEWGLRPLQMRKLVKQLENKYKNHFETRLTCSAVRERCDIL